MMAETTRLPLFSAVRKGIYHEVNSATLPGRIQHLADGLHDALMGVGDDELRALDYAGTSR